MSLPRTEREAFLAEPHIGSLAVVRADPARAPLLVPIWYMYEPGGELWFLTGRTSVKAEAIRAAGRISLLAERIEPTVRYVSVEGPVVSEEPFTREQLVAVASRYLAAETVAGYVETALKEHEPHVTFRVRPEQWLAADLGAF